MVYTTYKHGDVGDGLLLFYHVLPTLLGFSHDLRTQSVNMTYFHLAESVPSRCFLVLSDRRKCLLPTLQRVPLEVCQTCRGAFETEETLRLHCWRPKTQQGNAALVLCGWTQYQLVSCHEVDSQ